VAERLALRLPQQPRRLILHFACAEKRDLIVALPRDDQVEGTTGSG
jgi:hypothetical protein